nr:hypothetical protein BaRGS_019569 [Batillaria attramentaria]
MFLDAKKNDSWLSDNRTLVAEPDNPYNFTGKKLGTRIDKHFPFKLGEQFHMRILSTGVYEWSVFVDGSFYANHTVADPVTDIVYFNPVNDLHIAKLDLWCLQ